MTEFGETRPHPFQRRVEDTFRQRRRKSPADSVCRPKQSASYSERRQHSPDMNERSHLGQLIRRREFIAFAAFLKFVKP
jgi:hypothetical protein